MTGLAINTPVDFQRRYGNPHFTSTAAATARTAGKTIGHQVASEAPSGLSNIANKIFNWLNMALKKPKTFGNLSPEDIASRTMGLFGWYGPQGYLAFKEGRHPYETNIRNALTWTGTLAIAVLGKSSKFGVNTFLNQFMKPKASYSQDLTGKHAMFTALAQDSKKKIEELKTEIQDLKELRETKKNVDNLSQWQKFKMNREISKLEKQQKKLERKVGAGTNIEGKMEKKLKKLDNKIKGLDSARKDGLFRKIINSVRPKEDYFKILNESGVVDKPLGPKDRYGAYWSGIKFSRIDLLVDHQEKLVQEAAGFKEEASKLSGEAAKEALESAQLKEKASKEVASFVKRLITFKILSTSFISAMTIALIGDLVMKAAFGLGGRLDNKYYPSGGKDKEKDKAGAKAAEKPPSPLPTTASSPIAPSKPPSTTPSLPSNFNDPSSFSIPRVIIPSPPPSSTQPSYQLSAAGGSR